MSINRQKLWLSAKDYFFITFGIALYALGFCAFILPEKVVIGGLAGIGTIIYIYTGIPVGVSQFTLNLILLAFAYRIVGRQFVLGTIFGVTLISFFMSILQPVFTEPLTSEPFMNIVIGGIMCGFGIGLTFVHNGSSGGTDIVAAMVSKRSNVSVGRVMLYTDVIIISSSYLIYHSIDKVVYGFVVLFLVSHMADLMINTNRQAVQFTIFSPNWREIATAINNEAHRGCTVLSGTGWYSKQEVKVLLVMCRKIESVTVFRIIKSIDQDAFITQANVNGVYGKGFDEVKVKMRVDDPAHKRAYHNVESSTVAAASPSGHPERMA